MPSADVCYERHAMRFMPIAFTVLYLCTIYVHASPTGIILLPRANDDNDERDNSSIWVPVAVVGVIIIGLAAMMLKKNVRQSVLRFGRGALSGAAVSSGTSVPANGAREITAEQLAGTLRSPERNTAEPTRPRRSRRPRRTPSQISTTSLPAYMKEPGEQELVIFRGPADMEDVQISSERDGNERPAHSRDHSETSAYSDVPVSPNTMPLLEDDEPRTSPSEIQSSQATTPRSAVQMQEVTQNTTDVDEAIMNSDPRGAAPSYYEVVDLNQDNDDGTRASIPRPPGISPPVSEALPGAYRRSTFRNLFGAFNQRPSTLVNSPESSSHSRGMSQNSINSGSQEAASSPRRISVLHRPSLSGSGSLLSNFRGNPLARKRSTNTLHSQHNLSSPSTLSVNSISAPLSHTLVRTEFTYPKSGPTPEQLKLISSRDSFTRFGMPYGADAIAFAASTSRQELFPPPDFEEMPGSSLPELQRAMSNQSHNEGSSLPDESTAAATSHGTGHPSQSMGGLREEVVLASSSSTQLAPVSDEPTVSAGHLPEQVEERHENATSRNTNETVIADATSRDTNETATALSETQTMHSSVVAKVPPTAFKMQPTQENVRPASRASSIATYATAADTMSGADPDHDSSTDTEPTTPMVSNRDVL